jgi:hypothetical protein
VLERAGNARVRHLDLARYHIDKHRRSALVWHVDDVHLAEQIEQHAGQVRIRTRTRAAVIELARPRFREHDEVLHILHRQ